MRIKTADYNPGTPKSTEDLKRIYDYIYSKKEVIHPSKGKLGPYGSHDNRDGLFVRWIVKNIPKGSSVLDASCGRGHLMCHLHKNGYEVQGTEISKHLVNNDLKKLGFPVRLLAYEEYDQIESKSVDCVCSNDVLEHMLNENDVIRAVKNLARISRSAVCISVGAKRMARTYTVALGMTENGGEYKRRDRGPAKKFALELHRYTPGHKRWMEIFNRHMNIDRRSIYMHAGQVFVCGWVKK